MTTPAPCLKPEHLTTIQGRRYVRLAGLMALAYERGVTSLETTFTDVKEKLALATSTVVFADGSRFIDCADASPESVHASVRPHWRRIALARATARVLRLGLGIAECSVEELEVAHE